MRISDALACAIMALGIGVAVPAFADSNTINPDTNPADALRYGLNALKAGNVDAAVAELNFASGKGLVSAEWKLGEMYANGDGVARDDYKAFQLFGDIANNHADDSPHDQFAPYVSNAFDQLGDYYRTGIAHSPVKINAPLARQYFTYAASYFSDATAQVNLARMYYAGEGGDRDPIEAARWANLAADKGNADAQSLLVEISLDMAHQHLAGIPSPYDVRQATQWAGRAADYGSVDGEALYGQLLFDGDGITRQTVDGLMYLFIAVARVKGDDQMIHDMQAAAAAKATPADLALAKQRADAWLSKNPVQSVGSLTQ
jgi:exopolysaccharide production negative regulator